MQPFFLRCRRRLRSVGKGTSRARENQRLETRMGQCRNRREAFRHGGATRRVAWEFAGRGTKTARGGYRRRGGVVGRAYKRWNTADARMALPIGADASRAGRHGRREARGWRVEY